MSATPPFQRGDVYQANLDPQKGSEQKGPHPALIIQSDAIKQPGSTTIIVPFTSKTHTARWPTSVLVKEGDGGLPLMSVALCHQIRVIDNSGILHWMGTISDQALEQIEEKVRLALDL